jgi:hypothetical protein
VLLKVAKCVAKVLLRLLICPKVAKVAKVVRLLRLPQGC